MRNGTAKEIKLPRLGMGTWCFGGRTEHDFGNDDAGQIEALQKGIELGFRLIDTAEYYAAGYAESLIGRAIAGFDRKELFITSKVWKTNVSRDGVFRAAEGSLKRLGIDCLDCFLYHQFNPAVPLEETMGALNELIAQGMTRSIGVSNFSAALMARAAACSEAPLLLNQVHANLAVREALENLSGPCREQGIVLQAWRPLRDLEPDPVCTELCRKRGITFQQLCLAWLLNQPNVAVITAMKTPSHLKETLAAAELRLTPEEMKLLDGYPCRRPCGVPLA